MNELPGLTADPYSPAGDHARLVAWAHDCGRADARKHQEDMLARELPFAGEVAQLGERRLALLDERRVKLLAAADARSSLAELDRDRAAAQLAAARHALVAAGVDPSEVDMPPLERPPDRAPLVVGIASGTVIAAGGVVFGLLSEGPLSDRAIVVGASFVLAVCAMVAALLLREGAPESARITALRGKAADASARLRGAEGECTLADLEIRTLDERAVALAAAERRLPAEMLGAYCTSLLSALPPGALADGAEIAPQPDPTPAEPQWA